MTTIRLPVIEISKNNTFSIYRYGFVAIILSFLVMLIFIEDKNNFAGIVFLLVLVVYIGIGFFIKKPAAIDNGYLFISKDHISYVTNHRTTQYAMVDIDDITLVYSGYDGKTRTSSLLLLDTGNNNSLVFRHLGQEIYFRIHIKYEYISLLRQVFKELEIAGKATTIKE